MARFLLVTLGTLGDLYPFIELGKHLKQLNHTVYIASSIEYRDLVLQNRLAFHCVSPSMKELGGYRYLIKKIFHNATGIEFLIRKVLIKNLPSMYHDLEKIVTGVDVIVSHPLAIAAPILAEKYSLPWVSTVLTPMSFMSSYEPPLFTAIPWLKRLSRYRLVYKLFLMPFRSLIRCWEKPLQQLRQQEGLPNSRKIAFMEGQFSPDLTLGLFDKLLAKPQADWPKNLNIAGPCLYQSHRHILSNNETQRVKAFLDQGDTPLVFALGSSAVYFAGDFWQKAIEAAIKTKQRAILITGPSSPAIPSELKQQILAVSYLPYEDIFPHAKIIIHQAGIGTLAQAMRSGKPQLLVPAGIDQPDNAERAERLGVGVNLSFDKLKVDDLINGLEHILNNTSYLFRASILAKALKDENNGAAIAAQTLVEYWRSKQCAANLTPLPLELKPLLKI